MGRTCVFCASSSMSAELRELARGLGRALGENGDEVVYGGTMTGLMADVADGARAGGGRVIGVVPHAIAAFGSVDTRLDELVEVETLGERKQAMVRGAQRVVVLAGGLGTLDELVEVLTWRQLGLLGTEVDVVVLDPTGHWQLLRELLEHLAQAGAARPTATRVRWTTTIGDTLSMPAGPEPDGGPTT